MTYLLFLALLVFLVAGPKKLPDLMRQVGKLYAELRRAQAHFLRPFHDQINAIQERESAGSDQSQGSAAEQDATDAELIRRAS